MESKQNRINQSRLKFNLYENNNSGFVKDLMKLNEVSTIP